MIVRREPVRARLLQDTVRILFGALILAAIISPIVGLPPTKPWHLDWLGRVIGAIAAELAVVAVVRGLLPRPPEGAHMVGKSGAYVKFLLSTAFAEVALHPVLRFPFWYLHTTRVLYLKALGSEISWRVGFHQDFVVRDPSLVTLGKGSLLEPGVVIEVALHSAGRVRIAKVIIGDGCLVGAHTILMPGATIGHDVRIEPASLIGEDVHVGVGAHIGEGARLKKGVDLGSYATVGTGAILSEGVRVGDRAKIAPGAIVEAHTEIGERETWKGAPARRVENV